MISKLKHRFLTIFLSSETENLQQNIHISKSVSQNGENSPQNKSLSPQFRLLATVLMILFKIVAN
jgi:hypothetical protein